MWKMLYNFFNKIFIPPQQECQTDILIEKYENHIKHIENKVSKISYYYEQNQKYEKLLISIAEISQKLSNIEFSSSFKEVLNTIGPLMEVDRMSVFKYNEDTGTFTTYNNWIRNKNDLENLMNEIDLKRFPRWESLFSINNIISGEVKDFPEVEQRFFFSYGITSIMVSPINVDGKLWGILTLEVFNDEKKWLSNEEQAITALSSILSSHLYSKKLIKETVEKNKLLQETVKASNGYILKKDKNRVIEHIDKPLQDILDKIDGYFELSSETDDICMKNNESCHYIEQFQLENETVIFETIKIPIYEQNEFNGIIMIVWNKTALIDLNRLSSTHGDGIEKVSTSYNHDIYLIKDQNVNAISGFKCVKY